jgi:hypothetical protein
VTQAATRACLAWGGILARYGIEAPSPAAAALLGRNAVLAEYPSTPRRSRLSLFERAERVGGQDASGWVLYRIVKGNGQGSTGGAARRLMARIVASARVFMVAPSGCVE